MVGELAHGLAEKGSDNLLSLGAPCSERGECFLEAPARASVLRFSALFGVGMSEPVPETYYRKVISSFYHSLLCQYDNPSPLTYLQK